MKVTPVQKQTKEAIGDMQKCLGLVSEEGARLLRAN
jgi:hypothetical protein